MAITTGAFAPEPNPRADADAAAVYGDHDATRMRREAGIAAVAAEHTTGSAGESAIADGSFNLGQPTKTPGKTSATPVPDTMFKYPNAK
ncbi:hypothetical protein A5745_16805 [Mycobacterium sp. IS-2888]|uniref:hypothetical protein n=1 Tax=Mycobacterium sp. IS-2888 TaxID=1834159 RepID=UPI00096E9073|nr:hypothetical protein [Mycobacterium sp. IS-2888]OMC44095.1 hypothetical protein A5745_16805 [Mycobacterium sp. IS-2888]